MHQHLRHHCGTLHHAAVRCQIALQYGNSAGLGIRIFHRADDFRIQIAAVADVFADCRAVHGHAVEMEKFFLRQFVHYRIDTACLIQIFHVSRACRRQMAQIGGLRG